MWNTGFCIEEFGECWNAKVLRLFISSVDIEDCFIHFTCCGWLTIGSSDAGTALTEVGKLPREFVKLSDEMQGSICSP